VLFIFLPPTAYPLLHTKIIQLFIELVGLDPNWNQKLTLISVFTLGMVPPALKIKVHGIFLLFFFKACSRNMEVTLHLKPCRVAFTLDFFQRRFFSARSTGASVFDAKKRGKKDGAYYYSLIRCFSQGHYLCCSFVFSTFFTVFDFYWISINVLFSITA
jgi:hypothetical protein